MTDQPLVQFSTPIRANEEFQVVVRPTSLAEVDLAKAIIAKALLELAGPVKALAQGLKEAPATAVELLQQELGAVVLTEIPAPEAAPQAAPAQPLPQAYNQAAQAAGVPQGPDAPANAFNPGGHYNMPANAHQMNQGGNYGQPAPQWAQPQAPAMGGETGPCWAGNHSRECKDCGGPTRHVSFSSRAGKTFNKHECIADKKHGGRWCEAPIPAFKAQQAVQQGLNPAPGLWVQ